MVRSLPWEVLVYRVVGAEIEDDDNRVHCKES
jgi:hypothetical protein